MLRTATASIPSRYGWAKFSSEELPKRVWNKSAIEQAKKACRAGRVTLFGQSGSGKTSLAVAMLQAHLDIGMRPEASPEGIQRAAKAMFISSFDLTSAGHTPRTFSKEAPADDNDPRRGASPLLKRAMSASILLLDEVGGESGPEVVKEVIHYRHDNNLATWVTTFLTREQTAARYGGGIERRIWGDGACVIDVSARNLRVVS